MNHKLIHKVDKDFTVAPNQIFKDTNLSYKAKGLWLQILSLPEGWSFSIAGMSKLAKENESAIKTAFNELVEGGYLEWNHGKDEDGKFATTVITKLPQAKITYGETTRGEINDNKELKNKELNNNNNITNVILAKSPEKISKPNRHQVDLVVNVFDNYYGTKSKQRDRYASSNLLKRYGLKTVAIAESVLQAREHDQYAPMVSSAFELQQKIQKVAQYFKDKELEESRSNKRKGIIYVGRNQ